MNSLVKVYLLLLSISISIYALGWLLRAVATALEVRRLGRREFARRDAVATFGFDHGRPAKFYLCSKCGNYALSATDDQKVLRCEKCGRLYQIPEYERVMNYEKG